VENVLATIITIGDELLIGQVIDTNSPWMARELNQVGIWVNQRIAVGDQREDIWMALDRASQSSHIILITGGLGPTADDITKPVLAEYFHSDLVVDQEALANVTRIFEKILQRPLTERNRKQAEVPRGCRVIQNKRGTAPGMWFEQEGQVFISMPGVPHEMKSMMTDDVLPALAKRYTLPAIAHRTLLTAGIGESFLADKIQAFESDLPQHVKLAYLPNYGMVRLRLTASGENSLDLERDLEGQFANLKTLVGEWLVADQDISLEEAVGYLLKERKQTVATAESCTGGYIAHLLTSVPGSSQYYLGSVISYSNQVKENLLHVPKETLEQKGAVSEETVRHMAEGALHQLRTDFAIATSGIMGPDGGTPEKPVGTVWVAVASRQAPTISQKFWFRFDRRRNIELASVSALNMLRKLLSS
jgi:competence/damage-inducible protein CinA-like protein